MTHVVFFLKLTALVPPFVWMALRGNLIHAIEPLGYAGEEGGWGT